MVQDCKGLTRMCAPAVMQWHPTKKILAIGWETGEIQIWNEHDHELYEIVHLHKSDIKSVNWTSNGTRILTGDSVRCFQVYQDFQSSYVVAELEFQ